MEDRKMKTVITALLITLTGACLAGAASPTDILYKEDPLAHLLYIEERGEPDAIQNYDSIKYLSGKSERHFRQAWLQVFNEDAYVSQCVTAIKNQAVCVGANSVVNLSWTLEHEYPDNWYTVVCQGLAVWKHSD